MRKLIKIKCLAILAQRETVTESLPVDASEAMRIPDPVDETASCSTRTNPGKRPRGSMKMSVEIPKDAEFQTPRIARFNAEVIRAMRGTYKHSGPTVNFAHYPRFLQPRPLIGYNVTGGRLTMPPIPLPPTMTGNYLILKSCNFSTFSTQAHDMSFQRISFVKSKRPTSS